MIEQAIEKIRREFKESKGLSTKGISVGPSVVEALITFCKQNEEFAQAVVQSDKSVDKCIAHTVHNCGSSISDIEVYRRAVEFYFSGATVRFEMVLDIGDGGFSNKRETLPVAAPAPTGRKPLRLSLDDLF